MRLISNEMLLDTYRRAVQLELEQEFIKLLEQEIRKRNLTLDLY